MTNKTKAIMMTVITLVFAVPPLILLFGLLFGYTYSANQTGAAIFLGAIGIFLSAILGMAITL